MKKVIMSMQPNINKTVITSYSIHYTKLYEVFRITLAASIMLVDRSKMSGFLSIISPT